MIPFCYNEAVWDKEKGKLNPALFTKKAYPITCEKAREQITKVFTRKQYEKIRNEPDVEKKNHLKRMLDVWYLNVERFDNDVPENKNAHGNGAWMLDFDGLENPLEEWERIKEDAIAHGCLMMHLTPKGHGFHLMMPLPEGMDGPKAMEYYSALFGLECDPACKDIRRASFVPEASMFKHFDKDTVFGDKPMVHPKPLPEILEKMGMEKEESVGVPFSSVQPHPTKEDFEELGLGCLYQEEKAPEAEQKQPLKLDWNGIALTKIRDELLRQCKDITLDENGQPVKGCRHLAQMFIVQHMKELCDGDAEVLKAVVPNWEGDEKAWLDCIASAKKYAVQYEMSKVTRDAIESLQAEKAEEEKAEETDMKEPMMPNKLPKVVKIMLSKTPKKLWPSVLNSSFSALGLFPSGIWFRNSCNEKISTNVETITIGDSSTGKSGANKLRDALLRDVKLRDAESRRKEAELKKGEKRKKDGDDGKEVTVQTLPPLVQLIPPKTSSPQFYNRLWNAQQHEGKGVGMLLDELHDIQQFESQLGGKNSLKAILEHSYDNIEVGQDTWGDEWFTGLCNCHFLYHINCTPPVAFKYFKDGLTDGTLNRLSIAMTPQRDPLSKNVPRYGDYDDEEWHEEMRPYIQNLEDASGEIVCQEADSLIEELREEVRDHYALTSDNAYEELSVRGIEIAHRKLIILYVMCGRKWSHEIAELVRYMFRYDMYCKMTLFGDAVRKEQQSCLELKGKGGIENLLVYLDDVFTADDVKALKGKRGEKSVLGSTVKNWLNRGFVEKTEDGKYAKTEKGRAKGRK